MRDCEGPGLIGVRGGGGRGGEFSVHTLIVVVGAYRMGFIHSLVNATPG